MKKVVYVTFFALLAIGLLSLIIFSGPFSKFNKTQKSTPQVSKIMKITSSAFNNNENIPSKYTCDGGNFNPPLQFHDIPNNTKSLALIVDDPDAPMGTWVHWILFNIPPDVSSIAENSPPPGAIQGTSSFGKQGYGGPCPPSGTHRYFFKLYALDSSLTLNKNAKKEDLEKAMQNHIIIQAELIGLYKRQ